MRFAHSLSALALAVLGLGLSASITPQGNRSFTERDIDGRYTFVTTGEFLVGPRVGPAVAVGYIDFDGAGQIPFATQSLNSVGRIFNEDQEATGIYSVTPDGTGKMTITPDNDPETSFSFDFVIIDEDEIIGVMTNQGLVFHTRLEKQTD